MGVVFLNHGLGKLIGPPFAGAGMDGWLAFATQIGLPSPVALAWLWVAIETLGGLALKALRTAGVVYQVGGVIALLPGSPALLAFAAATAAGNLWVAWGIVRRRAQI